MRQVVGQAESKPIIQQEKQTYRPGSRLRSGWIPNRETGDGTDREQQESGTLVKNRSFTGRQAENAGKYLSLE